MAFFQCKYAFSNQNMIFYIIYAFSDVYPRGSAAVDMFFISYCHTRAQLGIQLDLNSCKSWLASWAPKGHDYVPVDHPPTRRVTQKLWTVVFRGMEVVWVVSGYIWKVSGKCLEDVWKVSGRCLETVWKVSGGWQSKFGESKFLGVNNFGVQIFRCQNILRVQIFGGSQFLGGSKLFGSQNSLTT